jgi:hypothetical protein
MVLYWSRNIRVFIHIELLGFARFFACDTIWAEQALDYRWSAGGGQPNQNHGSHTKALKFCHFVSNKRKFQKHLGFRPIFK